MDKIQFRIGLIALLIIFLHVALSLYVSCVPVQLQVKNKLVSMYRQLVVLGPFFTESRIKYSHHLSVRYQQNNHWSSTREFSKEQFSAYSERPWQMDRLSYIAYERHLAQAIGSLATNHSFESIKNNSSFRELNEYLVEEIIKAHVDSIQLVYGLDYYIPEKKSYLLDTIFTYTYSPGSIGKAKK